ncbi:hypothetical protein KVR01_009555 [Diaporthe batatas]|uniref:uncharacterized protein n=1 Tax=Diaporthe batatas TaxID=748121 RepID=UPI001D0490DA|nr:uncharacterized protein KVR01_009555 [Diaporthe batatas]KAG8161291.1 hypothetical protein KVR01_009555 [Diaporthe batatas]
MPTNRESSETIEIGRDYEYGPRYSESRPASVYYDDIVPSRQVHYEDYRPNRRGSDVYETVRRPDRYEDKLYRDKWQSNANATTHYLSPFPNRHGAQNQEVSLRQRPRSQSPVRYRDDEPFTIANRRERIVGEAAPPHRITGAPKRRRNSEPMPGLFQTIFDVNHPQDASVHLELPITDDYETELEEFCRLQRLGNFGAAEKYFRNHLEQHLSDPYVFVQYGQMLLEKGDYLAFEQLDAEVVFGEEDSPRAPPRKEFINEKEEELAPGLRVQWTTVVASAVPDSSRMGELPRDWIDQYDRDIYYERFRERSPVRTAQLAATTTGSDYDELELLRQNWRLMKSVCEIHTKGNYEDALNEAWYTIENFIQLAKLALELCAHIERVAPERYSSGLDEAAKSWIEWSALFKELLVQGRIWDFKDLYVAILAAFPDSEVTLYFGAEEDKPSALIDSWISDEGDESTNLAILDMILEPNQRQSAFMDEMKARVQAIITHCPKAMKSRSFIRWILASATDALTGGTKGWAAPETPAAVKEPIQLALNVAKELNDYKSQVACLKLLIFQSEDPTQLFQDLASLQKSMQGDNEGYLETLLSTYLVCKDRPSKEKLLEQLQQTEHWNDDTRLRDGLLYWSRDFIERALKRSIQGPKSTATLRHPPGFYIGKDLPKVIEQFTWQNAGQPDSPNTAAHTSYRQRRHDTATSSKPSNQTDGPQVIRPPPKPSPSYGRQSPWQSPHVASHDGSFDRRERDELEALRRELERQRELDYRETRERNELEAARRELERLRALEERERREREMRLRLEDAEHRRRLQEEVKIQAEQMAKKSAELEKLQHEHKLAKEKQDRENKAREDRDTRQRLERAEVSLRDQAERLRRAEDRSHQEWVTGRDKRHGGKFRWGKHRSRRSKSLETISTTSSDTYSSDSSRSSYYEDSDSDDDDARSRIRNESSGDEADHRGGDDTGSLQQNRCTDLVLYQAQPPEPPEAFNAQDSLPGSPELPPQDAGNSRVTETSRRARRLSRTTTKSSGTKGSRSRARRQSKEREPKDKDTPGRSHTEDTDGQRSSLAAASRPRLNKTSRSRSARGVEDKGKSVDEAPDTSKDSLNPDEITLFVKGSGILSIGNARLAIKDGEQITIRTNGAENPSSEMEKHRTVNNSEGGMLAKEQPAVQQVQSSSPTLGMASPNTRRGWKLEESQLQQPLSSPRHRHSTDASSEMQQNLAKVNLQREVDEILKSMDPKATINTTTGTFPSSPPARQPLERKELEDLYESVRRIGVEEGETSRQRHIRREKEELDDDSEYRARLRERIRARDRRSVLEVPSRRSTGMTEETREEVEARGEGPKDLTQEPQVIYELDQTGPDVMRNKHENAERYRDELSSKQQNEKIAKRPSNRHSRPPSIGMYGSPRSYMYDPAVGYDVWEDTKTRRMPRVLDDIRPLSRRTSSRLEYFSPPPPPPPVDRLQSPTKRPSVIIDADGRPHPIRTKSENNRSRSGPGDTSSTPHIVIRRGVSADGRRPRPEVPPVPGSRGRPQSVTGPIERHRHSAPEQSVTEKLPAENWEKETEGVWRKKKAVITVQEDPEEEAKPSPPQPQRSEGESHRPQTLLEPEQGISRKSTVTDPDPGDEE